MIVIQIAKHGNNNWCGYSIYRDNASFANTPHEAVGADTPNPKKLKNASLKIALGTESVRSMIGDSFSITRRRTVYSS